MGGHLHGGGRGLTVSQPACGRRPIYTARPTYAAAEDPLYSVRPLLHEPDPKHISWSQSATGWNAPEGHRLRVTAAYDATRPHMRVMGIAHVYVARERGRPGHPCAPPPADAVSLDAPFAGRSAPPRVDLTLAALGRDGRARPIDRPPGRIVRRAGDARVRVNHFAFSVAQPVDPARQPRSRGASAATSATTRRSPRDRPASAAPPPTTATAGRAASTRPASTASTARCTPCTCRSTSACADAQRLSVRRSSDAAAGRREQRGEQARAEADDAEHGEHDQHDREDERGRRSRASGCRRDRARSLRERPERRRGSRSDMRRRAYRGLTRRPAFRWDGAVPKYDAFGREIGEDTLAGPRRERPAPVTRAAARQPRTGRRPRGRAPCPRRPSPTRARAPPASFRRPARRSPSGAP